MTLLCKYTCKCWVLHSIYSKYKNAHKLRKEQALNSASKKKKKKKNVTNLVVTWFLGHYHKVIWEAKFKIQEKLIKLEPSSSSLMITEIPQTMKSKFYNNSETKRWTWRRFQTPFFQYIIVLVCFRQERWEGNGHGSLAKGREFSKDGPGCTECSLGIESRSLGLHWAPEESTSDMTEKYAYRIWLHNSGYIGRVEDNLLFILVRRKPAAVDKSQMGHYRIECSCQGRGCQWPWPTSPVLPGIHRSNFQLISLTFFPHFTYQILPPLSLPMPVICRLDSAISLPQI